jgi:hypothetical protein
MKLIIAILIGLLFIFFVGVLWYLMGKVGPHYITRPGGIHYIQRPGGIHYIRRPGGPKYIKRPTIKRLKK